MVPRLVLGPIGSLPSRVKFLAQAAGSKLGFAVSAVRAVAGGPFDIVVSGHVNLVTLGTLLGWAAGARTALVIHGIDAWSRHASLMVRACLPHMDCVIGVSNLTLGRFGRWARVDASRFRLLPNCVDLEQFTPGPKPAELMRQLGLDGSTVIMTLGRLASEERFKGFDEVIEVLPEIARSIPDITYLICGDGLDRDRLKASAEAIGVGDRVVFTGFVPETTKIEYYRLADAYVMPSRGGDLASCFSRRWHAACRYSAALWTEAGRR